MQQRTVRATFQIAADGTQIGSWWAKLKRGSHHFELLKQDIVAWMDSLNGAPPWTVTRHFDPTLKAFVFSVHDFPDLPLEWGLQLGDILNNFRSALDHAAWHLANSESTPPLTPEKRRGVQFPILDEQAKFPDAARRRLAGVPSNERAIIERHQPFQNAASPGSHPLALLRDLNDTDKHRQIRLLALQHNLLDVRVTKHTDFFFANRVEVVNDCHLPLQMMHSGTESIRVYGVPVLGLHPDVEISFRAQFTIGVESGLLLDQIVVDIGNEILSVLTDLGL